VISCITLVLIPLYNLSTTDVKMNCYNVLQIKTNSAISLHFNFCSINLQYMNKTQFLIFLILILIFFFFLNQFFTNLWCQATHSKYHSHHSNKWSGSSVQAVKATCQQSTRRRSSRSRSTFSSKKPQPPKTSLL
jgi:hypothetical protein